MYQNPAGLAAIAPVHVQPTLPPAFHPSLIGARVPAFVAPHARPDTGSRESLPASTAQRRLIGGERIRRADSVPEVSTKPECFERRTIGIANNRAQYQWVSMPCPKTAEELALEEAARQQAKDNVCRKVVGIPRRTDSPDRFRYEVVPCEPPKKKGWCSIL